MAKVAWATTKLNDGKKMSAFQNALPQTYEELNGKRGARSKPYSLDRARANRNPPLITPRLHFGSHQLAQITRAIFDQGHIGIAILDLDGRIQQVNQAFASLLGYEKQELTGKSFEELSRGVEVSEGLRTTKEAHESSPFRVNRLVRKSGKVVECVVDSHPIFDDNGKVNSFLAFVSVAEARRDTEKRNRFESELYRAQALQTLGALAAGVAHDFNNALEVIIGFASLTRIRLAPTDPLHEPLKIIEESAKGAAGLAHQLLVASRTNEADKKTIDVRKLIHSVLTIITRTFDRKIQIEHRIASKLPFVAGFRNRLEHAVLNLCINARDAMPQGGTLTITATSHDLARTDKQLPASNSPGTYVRIAVRDNGSGMTAEVVEHIFVPLFTTKEPGRGSGLGLAMVDRVVKEEQGFICVNSKPGEGSEFAIYLPAVFSPGRCPTPRSNRLIPGKGTVLVVDDEPRVLEFLEKGLTRLGYTVIPAESGRKACEIYAAQSLEIDTVLLDMVMPGMSGLDACAELQNINPCVRIILSSGYTSRHIKSNVLETGIVEFLEKPYTLDALSQMLHKVQQN